MYSKSLVAKMLSPWYTARARERKRGRKREREREREREIR